MHRKRVSRHGMVGDAEARFDWRPWIAEDLETLRENAGKVPVRELARMLGRTMKGVYGAADKIGLVSLQALPGGDVKLTWDQAREIRARKAAGERTIDLAHAFGVCPRTVQRIANGWSWRERRG